ncbi:NAD(+) diphosphatase [Natronospira bacteriovora]|uniref:NAD(+) diphosphatase n=1 Tax=Natronospira bacteriovora TaxID=3069753 RepID=A0ABU0W9N8_9GAMM|nr:NAD(+) diphosphatase [Natronospira sp. AB-CW4]MDQ2069690.1 NAD(+) diphosphatase [Natronospira sp. AB-CW4]
MTFVSAEGLEPRWQDPECRILPVCEERVFLLCREPSEQAPRLLAPRRHEAGELLSHADTPVWVGELEGQPCFAVRLHRFSPRQRIPGGDFTELRSVAGFLSDAEWQLLARAKALVHWHDSHGFCARCGHPTRREAAGLSRCCENPACATRHFPRTDPAVIVRVCHRDRLLLARQPSWPEKRRSVLAGFVSPGETAEQAAIREIHEEAGLDIDADSLRYFESQPWPFPGSLMLAYTAETRDETIRCLDGELREAAWWTRDALRDAVRNGDIQLPTHRSVARSLIEDWLAARP